MIDIIEIKGLAKRDYLSNIVKGRFRSKILYFYPCLVTGVNSESPLHILAHYFNILSNLKSELYILKKEKK